MCHLWICTFESIVSVHIMLLKRTRRSKCLSRGLMSAVYYGYMVGNTRGLKLSVPSYPRIGQLCDWSLGFPCF